MYVRMGKMERIAESKAFLQDEKETQSVYKSLVKRWTHAKGFHQFERWYKEKTTMNDLKEFMNRPLDTSELFISFAVMILIVILLGWIDQQYANRKAKKFPKAHRRSSHLSIHRGPTSNPRKIELRERDSFPTFFGFGRAAPSPNQRTGLLCCSRFGDG